MKTQTMTSILSRLTRTLAIGALCIAPLAVRATPYATSMTNNAGLFSFRLNESGIVTVVSTNGSGNLVTNNLGNQFAGLINTNVGNLGDFTVIVAKTNTPGYVSGVSIQVSNDSTNSRPVVNTNTVRFNSPRGVAINKNAASPYFGRIYVANSTVGGATRAVGDGIYLLNADFSDAVAQGTNARTAGITTFTNTVPVDDGNTPYRLEVGEDSNLYIADTSTNSGTIYVTDPEVLTGTNLIAGLGIFGNPNSLAPSANHGRIASSVFATGSTNAGNLVVYAIDTDNTTTSDTVQNHIMKWDVGAGPLPVDPTVGVALTNIDEASLLPVSGITADLARGPDGKFYTMQYRLVDADPGLYVVDPTTDLNVNGAADVIYNSLSDTIGNHGVTRDFLFGSRAVAVSPDGKYIGVLRDDNQIWVVSLTNGIPDLSQRRLVAQGTSTTLSRDIAFDAAGNLYIVSSGQAIMRTFSPGYTTIARTTLSGVSGNSFSVTNIVPDEVKIIATSTNAAEPGVTGEVVISRTGPAAAALTVNYVIAGTASRNSDYQTNVAGIGGGVTNSITLPIGVSSTNIVVTPLEDPIGEAVETVTFTLLSSASYVSANNQAAIIFITDDGIDLPGVSVIARGLGSYELIPYRPAKFLFTLQSSYGSDVVINGTLAGTAVSGTDYVEPSSFSVTIPAGSTSVIKTVTPIDNAAIAGNKIIICNVEIDAAYTNIGIVSATNTLRSDDYAALSSLYSDDFDIDHTADWVVKFTTNDVSAEFFFDYSTVGIPSAPRSVGGTTRGMKLKTHLAIASARVGISVAPTNQAFGGNYRLRFDSWFNFAGPLDGTGTGSTETFIAGVGGHQTRTNVPGSTAAVVPALGMGPTVAFSYAADGGYGTGAGIRDIALFTNTITVEATSGYYLAGTSQGARDNTNAYYAEFGDLTAPAAQLTALPGQTRTNGVGILGMSWHDVIIDRTSSNVTWTVDGLLIANVPIASFYSNMGSNIFFAMDDSNSGSIASPAAAQFALVDNVIVEALPVSSNADLSNLSIAPAGALTPAFAAGTVSYTATNIYSPAATVTATKADGAASLQLSVNGGAFAPITSAVASPVSLSLNPQLNTITVRVTAMDTVTTKDYTANLFVHPSTTVPTITNSLSGSTLTLNWAADHVGYSLQTQTNPATTGIGSTWFTVPDSQTNNSITISVDPANPTVFYRLIYAYP